MEQSPSRPMRATRSSARKPAGNNPDDLEWSVPEQPQSRRRRTGATRASRKEIKFPDLTIPLSEWAKQTGIQPKDIQSFATRDIKKRIAQAESSGYVKRNLNVFFLYKRAFRDVAQAWMEIHHPEQAKTQPPLVTLVGESWAKESLEFKKSYTYYSDLERDGLRLAFPDYKYRPGYKKDQATESQPEKHAEDADDDSTRLRQRSASLGPGGSEAGRSHHDSTPESSSYPEPASGSTRWKPTENGVPGRRANGLNRPIARRRGAKASHIRHSSSPSSVLPDYQPFNRDFIDPYLHPQHAGLHIYNNGRMRSESPALSHHSHQMIDGLPIDPSLSGSYSDYFPSRAASEEPGYMVPSQMHHAITPDLAPQRHWSSPSPYLTTPLHHSNLSTSWSSNTMNPRFAPKEPWQESADAMLSSVPVGDGIYSNLNGSNSLDWQLDSVTLNEQPQSMPWDMSNWGYDFTDGELD